MKTTVAQRFLGFWSLVSEEADGMICYHPSGEMSVQSAPRKARTRAGEVATAAEALSALDGYVAYMGTWSIDEAAGTVTHRPCANVQPGAPAVLVRRYGFESDSRLILRPVDRDGEIVWQRII